MFYGKVPLHFPQLPKRNKDFANLCYFKYYKKSYHWMFWVCFPWGSDKSQCTLTKGLKKNDRVSYCQGIFQIVIDYTRTSTACTGIQIQFTHDNAHVHKVAIVKGYLKVHEIEPVPYSAYPPNLNSNENAWGLMKIHIPDQIENPHQGSYRRRAEILLVLKEAQQECIEIARLVQILSGL